MALPGASLAAAKAPAPTVPSPQDNLFIYRDHAEPPLWPAAVVIDGKNRVSLGQKTYSAFRLEPGDHKIKLSWSILSGQISSEAVLTVEPGKTYVFGLEGVYHPDPARGISVMLIGSRLSAIPPQLLPLVQPCCQFKPPTDPAPPAPAQENALDARPTPDPVATP